MARIQYADKEQYQTNDLPEENKWTAANATEVKNSVNALYNRGTYLGAYDASGNAYPAAGAGSGESGAIQAGDEWYLSVGGDLNVNGVGVITVNPGATIKALVAAPGQIAANWKVYQ